MSRKSKRSLKEKLALKNSLVKEALSEFLGTFILIVSVSCFPFFLLIYCWTVLVRGHVCFFLYCTRSVVTAWQTLYSLEWIASIYGKFVIPFFTWCNYHWLLKTGSFRYYDCLISIWFHIGTEFQWTTMFWKIQIGTMNNNNTLAFVFLKTQQFILLSLLCTTSICFNIVYCTLREF